MGDDEVEVSTDVAAWEALVDIYGSAEAAEEVLAETWRDTDSRGEPRHSMLDILRSAQAGQRDFPLE